MSARERIPATAASPPTQAAVKAVDRSRRSVPPVAEHGRAQRHARAGSDDARSASAAPPRRRSPRLSTLHWALGASLLVHLVLITFRFVDPERFNRLFRDTPLEVILVNARSNEVPLQAQAIAQASLAGGGDAEKGLATSPLPAMGRVELGDSAENSRRRVDQLQDQQRQLLAQIRREMAMLQPPDPKQENGQPDQAEQDERRRQLLKLLAEIEKRINEDNLQPKKRYISPATKESMYALYYDRLRRRIEDQGTRDFPEYRGAKLYGELTMNLTVDAQGQVVDTDVVRGSGNKVLDTRAMAIVRAAAPFGRFSDEMAKGADQIVVTSRFRFTRDEGLATTLSAGPN